MATDEGVIGHFYGWRRLWFKHYTLALMQKTVSRLENANRRQLPQIAAFCSMRANARRMESALERRTKSNGTRAHS